MEREHSPTLVKIEDHSSQSSVPNPTSALDYSSQYVQNDTEEETLEELEQKFRSAVDTLGELDAPLTVAKDDRQAALFLDRAKDLLNEAPTPETIIGVAGPTGAGKSSVINAVLREEYMVPTSCVRACTSVVTEISWNESDDPDELYRAEIEFLTVEEWGREVELFCGGLADCSNDLSSDFGIDDKGAGVAWEKMRAVYPQYTKQGLMNASAEELANLPEIRNITGTTEKIAKSSCKALHDELLQYIDSKEKDTGTSKAAKSKVDSEEEDQEEELTEVMELWPMIKVVRVFTKSDALSTGAIIVDLPGVHDANAARAVVADEYLQRCSNIWIVAPISRAVDDKTAQNLLGQSFRRQLRYDGADFKITFICTKTDDISTKEVIKSLRLKQAAEDHDRELGEIEAQSAEALAKRGELLQREKDGQFAKNETEQHIREWKFLRKQLGPGKVVYAPKHTPRKRKSKQSHPPRQKSSYVSDSGSDNSSTSEDTGTECDDDDDSLGEPLTKEQIQQKLDELQTTETEIRASDKRTKKEIKAWRTREKDLKREKKWSETRLKFVCIQARNNYAREALQQHYAAGIRDWDYQKAPQRHEQGKIPPDFDAWNETEVPQLQKHTKNLTEENRTRHYKRFMAKFMPISQALEIWSHDGVVTVHLAEGEKKEEADWIDERLVDLRKDLEERTAHLMKDCRNLLEQHVFSKSKADSLVQRAVDTAVGTARAWGEKDAEGQSLPWVTYKAICRHEGDFTGRKGRKDFNQDLVQPLMEDMRGSWERLFRREIPDAIEQFPPIAEKSIRDFDIEVRKRIKAHPRLSVVEMDGVSPQWYIASIRDLVQDFGESIAKMQKKINRQFEPSIAKSMKRAYTACVDESGPGSFARMKEVMCQHVSGSRGTMFWRPFKTARSKLIEKCNTEEKKFLHKIDNFFGGMKTEYYQAIIGRDISKISKKARIEVSNILARSYKLQGFSLDDGGTH